MKISQAFPSDYLKSADVISRGEPILTIGSVSMEKLGDHDEKPVMHFQEDCSMVLNKTNSAVLADAYGDETTEWHGKRVKLVVEKVNYQGKLVDGIRVKTPKKKPAPAPAPAPVQAGEPSADFDDEIPF